MACIGRITEFVEEEEDIETYLVRLKHFFKAHKIEDGNRVSVLITVLGPKNLAILSDLLSPSAVDSKTYYELTILFKKTFLSYEISRG